MREHELYGRIKTLSRSVALQANGFENYRVPLGGQCRTDQGQALAQELEVQAETLRISAARHTIAAHCIMAVEHNVTLK